MSPKTHEQVSLYFVNKFSHCFKRTAKKKKKKLLTKFNIHFFKKSGIKHIYSCISLFPFSSLWYLNASIESNLLKLAIAFFVPSVTFFFWIFNNKMAYGLKLHIQNLLQILLILTIGKTLEILIIYQNNLKWEWMQLI